MKLRWSALSLGLTAVLSVGVNRAMANVIVTGAAGGEHISADTAADGGSPAWTTLAAITIAEGASDDFAFGSGETLVLKTPAGFEFNTASTPEITFTPDGNITDASVAFSNSTTLVITLDVSILPLFANDTLTIGSPTGIEVRPTAGGPLAAGKHIYRPSTDSGSATIAGIVASADGADGSDFGALAEVAGAAALIRVETSADGNGTVVPAQEVTAGSSITTYAITRDAYSNFVTNEAAETWLLPAKTGGLADGDLVPAADGKSAVFTGHVTGTATIGATSGPRTQVHSGMLTVVAGPAAKMFVTLPNETFTGGAGNSGSIVAQTAGTPFTIPRLTAADSFTNIATSYSGSKDVTWSGPSGSPTYTSPVDFTNGQSTTTLTTTLTQPETTTIAATADGLIGVPSSLLTVRPPNTPPTIAALPDQSVFVDHPALVVLHVHDAETAVTNLQLSLVSSDPVLIPPENVVLHYFYFDGNWYFTVAPAFGLSGIATNTVIVSDGTNSASTNFVLTVNPPPPGAAWFATTNALTIPESGAADPYPSTINVTGMDGAITNLTLSVRKFAHKYPEDLSMLLVGPLNQGVVIFSRVGGGQPATNVNFTLTQASPFTLPDTFELWSEQFRPADFATSDFFPPPAPPATNGHYGPVTLSSFNGQPANGTWSLYVYDHEPPDHGGIGGWSLMIATDGRVVTPRPTILSIARPGSTNVVITWSAISNVTYRVQYHSGFDVANWVDLTPDITATNDTASATDNSSDDARRFYRVRVVP